jgi:hypothetical protein
MVIVGFAYDVLFAGIPYQDPTPELQAQYVFLSSIAGMCYKTGAIVLLAGLLVSPIIWKKQRENANKARQRIP